VSACSVTSSNAREQRLRHVAAERLEPAEFIVRVPSHQKNR
jgi:hypothetical protein